MIREGLTILAKAQCFYNKKNALTMHRAVDIIYPVLQLVQRIHDKGGGLSSVSHKQWIFQEENY